MPEERDIGAELYELVRADFERYLEEQSPDLPDMSVANMKQADSYAHLVGRCLALAIAEHVKPEVLPDGRLYYNIAEKILDPTLRENHRLVNEFCGEIQKLINERQGINIRPQTAKYPEERAHSLINAAAHEEDWDKTERILDDSVRTLTDSFYTDNVKANADLRSKAGLRVEIVREGGSKCCPWCADLVGRYAYPDEVPKDVYRRHDNCTCSVTYVNGRARQNVWTKAQWRTPAERAERIAFAKSKAKPTVFTKEQASAIRERVGGLTYGSNSDRINIASNAHSRNHELEKIIKYCIEKEKPVFADDLARYFSKIPPENNKYLVALHGTPKSAFIYDHEIDARILSHIIKNRKDYNGTDEIVLISCNTGSENVKKCFAQELADEMNIRIYAPTHYGAISPWGTYYSSDEKGKRLGRFIPFDPQKEGADV